MISLLHYPRKYDCGYEHSCTESQMRGSFLSVNPHTPVIVLLKFHKLIMFNISIVQISIWIWSNALYNNYSRGNQINIAQITILQLLFTNQMNSNQIKCWFFMRGENQSKNLSWQSREPTNSIHIWHPVQKSNRGHIGGRQVLSPLGQPCCLRLHSVYTKFGLKQADVIQHFSYCITDLQKTDVVLSTECLNKLHIHCLITVISQHT